MTEHHPNETDKAMVLLLRILVVGMALMLVNQVVNVVLGATRSCPACAKCPLAERP